MQSLVLLTLIWVLTIQLPLREGWAPGSVALVPEIVSALVLLYVAFRWLATRRLYLPHGYLIALGALLLCMLCAIVWQAPPAGAIVAGLRHYFKFLPLLLLPAVLELSPKHLRLHLLALGAVVAIQPPVALYQRFVEFSGDMHSGDLITGTLGSSGAVSMVMIGAVAFLTSAYVRSRISLVTLSVGGAYCCIPVMINETKISVVLIPVVLVCALLATPNWRALTRKLVPVFVAGALILAVFVAVYDYIAEFNEFNTPIADFLTEESLRDYLYTGNRSAVDVGYVGRVDSIVLAAQNIAADPIVAAFGLGPGNASPSSMAGLAGDYARYDTLYGVNMTEISRLLWEVGFLGTAVFALFIAAQFRAALRVAREPGQLGFFGHAWFLAVIIMAACLFYIPLLGIDDVSAPFWFYAGVVGAARARLEDAARSANEASTPRSPSGVQTAVPLRPLYTRDAVDKRTV